MTRERSPVAARVSKVLHIGKFYPPHKGGMETHLRDLCAGLSRSLDVEVIVANDSRRTELASPGGIPVTRVGTPINVLGAPISPGTARLVRDARAQIVHLHFPHPTAAFAFLASRVDAPLVISWHSDIVRQRIATMLIEPLMRRVLARCGALIAGSDAYLDSSPVLSANRARCHVIPYGVPVEKFAHANAAPVAELRRRHGDRIILAVGRMIYYKGFEHLVRAMAGVRGTLVIAGDGPMRARLEREAREPGIAGRVVFAGRVPDSELIELYHACDVFALPSIARSEAFGIVQLEAMACGKPVVNTRLDSGASQVSIDGVTGLTVAPGDSLALASALNTLLDNPSMRKTMGEAGLHRVREEFSIAAMVRQTIAVYQSVLPSLALKTDASSWETR